MARATVLHFLCVFGVLPKGLTTLIQTQHTVMVATGDQALLNCELMQQKEVLQVTWQKVLPEGKKTLATSNKYFGQGVSADFKGKVEFIDAGLQNSSIVIREVTELDEGCYRCLFNSYPQGALTGTTCLQVYELHGPVLNVTQSNSTEEVVVSCSATARPAPTVTLRVLGHDVLFTKRSSANVANANGTVTATVTAVLPSVREGSTQVGCAVRVLSSPPSEVFMMIPEVKQSSAEGFDEESRSHNEEFNVTWIVVLSTVVACGCCAAIIIITTIICFRQKHQKSPSQGDTEGIKTPQRPIGHIHEIKTHATPCVKQENEQLRQRTPAHKTYEIGSPKAPTVRCQLIFQE